MLEDLRDLVWIIDPSHDALGSLVAKMRSAADALLGDRCRFVVDDALPLGDLSMRRRRELLMIYKELVHNVARHAGPSAVEISLASGPDGLVLQVADEWVGFDSRQPASGHGLGSIRARAKRLGGELHIESSPGQGTRATLVVP